MNGHSNGYANGGYTANGTSNGYHKAPAQPAYDLTPEEYRSKHDLVVLGDSVPDPIQSFDAAGFTPDIMDEVFIGCHSHLLLQATL